MIRDPFYRQIVEGLNAPLDPDLFERCATDLLREIYSTLVPIAGGSDAGMDGAIADLEGEPFPLVATTGKNVIGNLRRSLNSYLRNGGTRRKAVLATSQKLTPKRIQNLYRRARELGFVLVQVYSQEAFANLLHNNPRWCLELLNLTGDPAPLSAVPRTERPLLNLALVGREEDLDWLRQTPGDKLLVGQPGSGKTFLLRKLALEGIGLFVVSEDRGAIAAAIRSVQRAVLIVDDAHIRREILTDLRQMREATGAEFSILTSCWPGDEEAIAQVMNLPGTRIRRLDLLTRDEIVNVINAVGLGAPRDLIREIVNQAEGRPGLAVTLAHLCLQGGVREVALGDVLSSSVVRFFEPVVGQRASALLAAFSIGGDAGMPMQIVADELGLNLIDVRESATRLAAGGIVFQAREHRLSVRPAALRHVLVRDVFFRGAMSLPVERLLLRAPDANETALTLIGSKARGAVIQYGMLTAIVEQAQSSRVWIYYSALGRDEATWVLMHHPEQLITVARQALANASEVAIPLLLTAAIGDQRQLHSTPEQPLRLIGDWINSAYPGSGEAILRRRTLLDSVRRWLADGGDPIVALRAFQFVLSPGFEDHTTDPGRGMTVMIQFGYLLHNELIAVRELWTDIRDTIRQIPVSDWEPLQRIISDWAYSRWPSLSISQETSTTMRSFAGEMLRDLVALAVDRPGILHWANRIAKHLQLAIEIPLDPAYEVIYPEEDLDDWRAQIERQQLAIQELAVEWSGLHPRSVTDQIVRIEREAQLAQARWPRWTPLLCDEIARRIASPGEWARTMIDASGAGDLVIPFLRKAAALQEPGWITLAADCLEQPSLCSAAIPLVITMPDAPEELLEQVLQRLEGYAGLVQIHCALDEVPERIVVRLLRHESTAIVNAAAVGEWNAEPKGTVRDSLRDDWQHAIVHRVDDYSHLGLILARDPVLAYDWLQARVQDASTQFFQCEAAVRAAVSALDEDARRRLLHQVPVTYGVEELVICLIGDNLDLYRELLSIDPLSEMHLAPLSGDPEGIWVQKAILALDAGYSVEQVAGAAYGVYGVHVSWRGNESEMWTGWIERFDRLLAHKDERIRRAGEAGRSYAVERREHALREERDEAIYGMR